MKSTLAKLYSVFSVVLLTMCLAKASTADVILTIDREGHDTVEYTLEDLEKLTPTIVKTTNDFVDDLSTFSGPLVRDILAPFGPDLPETVVFVAANEYFVEIPVSDFDTYDVIMAHHMDGELLSPRDKGPLWVIYPMAEHKELQDAIYNARLIWQVVRMEIR